MFFSFYFRGCKIPEANEFRFYFMLNLIAPWLANVFHLSESNMQKKKNHSLSPSAAFALVLTSLKPY